MDIQNIMLSALTPKQYCEWSNWALGHVQHAIDNISRIYLVDKNAISIYDSFIRGSRLSRSALDKELNAFKTLHKYLLMEREAVVPLIIRLRSDEVSKEEVIDFLEGIVHLHCSIMEEDDGNEIRAMRKLAVMLYSRVCQYQAFERGVKAGNPEADEQVKFTKDLYPVVNALIKRTNSHRLVVPIRVSELSKFQGFFMEAKMKLIGDIPEVVPGEVRFLDHVTRYTVGKGDVTQAYVAKIRDVTESSGLIGINTLVLGMLSNLKLTGLELHQ